MIEHDIYSIRFAPLWSQKVEEVEEAGIRRIILPVNLSLTMNCFPGGQVLASKQHAVKDTNAVRNHKNTPDKGWATIEIRS